MDFEQTGISTRNWVDSAQDMDYWRALVNAALKVRVPQSQLVCQLNHNRKGNRGEGRPVLRWKGQQTLPAGGTVTSGLTHEEEESYGNLPIGV